MTTTTDTSAMTLAQKSDRILAQTRGLSGATPNATRLIEELRWALETNRNEVSLLRSTVTDLNIEIERLRKERDETTASLDALLLIQAAQAHGFDCCKENSK